MSSSTFRTLTFRSKIDTSGFDAGITALTGKTGTITRDIGTQIGNLTPAFDKLDKGLQGSATKAGKLDFGNAAGSLVASFLPAGAAVVGAILVAVGGLKSVVKDVGATISKQLHDSFRLTQVKDEFDSMEKYVKHDIAMMKFDFDQFSKQAGASSTTTFAKMKAGIKDASHELKKLLLLANASFKKGGLPTFDDLFTQESRTYKGGKKGGEKGGGGGGGSVIGKVAGKLNPIKSASRDVDAGSASLLKLGAAGVIAGAAVIGLGTGFQFLSKGIQSASSLNETISKTKQVLGDASPMVEQFADGMAYKFGLVKGVTLDVASGFGGLARGLGHLQGMKLAGFTTQFTALAADLSSFKNIDLKTAGDALRIGLSGEQSDQLKSLGIVMGESTVKAKAYAMGIAQVGSELTETQKFAARAAVIQSGLNRLGATGDLARTADGTANQYRKLVGTIENLGTAIGTMLLPVVNAAIGVIGQLVGMGAMAFETSKGAIGGAIDFIVDKIDIVSAVVGHFPAAVEVARLKIFEAMTNIGEYFAVLGPNAIIVATYIATNWKSLVIDAFNATLSGLQNLWKNWQAVGTAIGEWFANPTAGFNIKWTPLLDGFKATAEKFPALLKPTLTDMSAQIAEAGKPITDDIAGKRAKRAADKLKGPEAPKQLDDADPDAAGKAKKGQAPKLLAGAEEVGTKEAYSSIVKAIAGSRSGSVADKQLTAQQQANRTLQKIEQNSRGANPPGKVIKIKKNGPKTWD
jgi:hypothetical protein